MMAKVKEGVNSSPLIVTCSAPTNIAILKYWGKRNEDLVLPLNSSLSTTLDQDQIKTTTTIFASKTFETDRIWLNGKEEDIQASRIQNCLYLIRSRAQDKKNNQDQVVVNKDEWPQYKLHIVSKNNFPTAAGLASSAAGFACLVFSLAQLFNFQESYPHEISSIARMGSGSACRSLSGGWVKWIMGTNADGSDSIAVQLADEHYWPELSIVALIFTHHPKFISSTTAMQNSTKSSTLIKYRVEEIAPKRLIEMEKALLDKDFPTLGQLIMRDSNQFHAICLDSYPPIMYLNQNSKLLIQLITAYNSYYKKIKAAYTFDAGSNPFIYTTREFLPELTALLDWYFELPNPQPTPIVSIGEPIKEYLTAICPVQTPKIPLERIIFTKLGPGPQILSDTDHLIDVQTGLPFH